MLSSSHEVSRFKNQTSPTIGISGSGSFNTYSVSPYPMRNVQVPAANTLISPTGRLQPVEMPQDMRQPAMSSKRMFTSPNQRHDPISERFPAMSDKMYEDAHGGEKRNRMIAPPPPLSAVSQSAVPPLPKKARYDPNRISQPAKLQQLRIDTSMSQSKMKMDGQGGYHPETEAISPTLPTASHDSKSDMVSSISQVDREIIQIENQLQQLEKEQASLEAEAAKPKQEITDEEFMNESKPLGIAQIIYHENKKLAQKSHLCLSKFGQVIEIPLYHQPCDTEVFHSNLRHYQTFKSLLKSHFKQKVLQRAQMHSQLADRYETLFTSWLKKVDAKSTIKKSIKDQKTREYFEKVFPELKKSREDKERLTNRVSSRGGSSGYARTEAEFEQIIDGINEQEEEDKKMKAYAIIPPLLCDSERRHRFINRNGLVKSGVSEYNERKRSVTWLPHEEALFKDKYLERPKQFGLIADLLDKKSLNDCVLYYYSSKKAKNYKQLVKKQVKRPHRKPTMKPSLRNTNEIPVELYQQPPNTEQDKKSEDEEVIRVTRSSLDESKCQCCAVCGLRLESYTLSHAVTKATCSQYGLNEQDFQADWRICANCVKLCRRRNNFCPIPSCTSPRQRMRYLHVKWSELTSEKKENILKELGVSEEVNRSCSTCYDKILELLGCKKELRGANNDDLMSRWSDADLCVLKQGLSLHGKNWTEIASKLDSKSPQQCKLFFYRNRRRQNLEPIYNEYKMRKSQELGCDLEPSDDSMYDEFDDDNVEDNDLSSDNETGGANDVKTLEPKTNAIKPELENLSGKLVNGDASAKGELLKKETLDNGLKVEKLDHDSSATASADEDQGACNSHFDLKANSSTMNSMSLAASIIKQEPGLMENPDGMMSHIPPSQLLSHRPQAASASGSTSVKELIDLAIEDALTSRPQDNSSHDLHKNIPSNRSSPSPHRNQILPTTSTYDKRSDKLSRSATPNRPSVVRDDNAPRRQMPLPPYKGDPREIFNSRELPHHHPGSSANSPYSQSGDKSVIRAPPPAHSHHITQTQLDQRNISSDRKSPAKSYGSVLEAPYSAYDGQRSPSHRDSPSHSKQNLGQPPPPLISNPLLHHAQIKREASHAGGSILQGTSANHLSSQQSASSQQPSRFEVGSISHGTPRSIQESKLPVPSPLSSRGSEKNSRSPRPQQASAPPPSVRSPFDRILEQQQQQQQVAWMQWSELMRRNMLSQLQPGFPADYTKTVLHNDFLTAQQMAETAMIRPSFHAAPHIKDEKSMKDHMLAMQSMMATGFMPGMADQTAFMSMMAQNPRMMQSHALASEQQRLSAAMSPTAVSVANQHTPYIGKDSLAAQMVSSSRGERNVSSPHRTADGNRMQHRGNMMSGSTSKTDVNRRSVSPIRRPEHKTQYERELEEMRVRSISERTRTDSERTLTDTESSQPLPSQYLGAKPSDYYSLSRSTPSIGARSEPARPDSAPYSSPFTASHHKSSSLDGLKDRNSMNNRMVGGNSRHPLDDRRPVSQADQEAKFGAGMDLTRLHPNNSINSRPDDDPNRCRKGVVNSGFASKRLAEVSKGLEKEQLHKDASSLFSSSFEKDSQLQWQDSSKFDHSNQPQSPMTAARIIDAIITKQINHAESDPSNMSHSRMDTPITSSQHTSVIVPPKKPRMIHTSHSDTDLASQLTQASASPFMNLTLDSMNPVPRPSSSGSTVRPITLSEKISEIITNNYEKEPNERRDSLESQLESKQQKSTPRPYRVEDVEPISPPSSKLATKPATSGAIVTQSKPTAWTKKQSGTSIRSLLKGDPTHDKLNHRSEHHETYGNMTPIEYVKTKIEEAIRHDTDFDSSRGGLVKPVPRLNVASAPFLAVPTSGHGTSENDTNATRETSKKKGLEAMLAPPNKRSLSPLRAKSPEEVDIYSAKNSQSLSRSSATSSNQTMNYSTPSAVTPYSFHDSQANMLQPKAPHLYHPSARKSPIPSYSGMVPQLDHSRHYQNTEAVSAADFSHHLTPVYDSVRTSNARSSPVITNRQSPSYSAMYGNSRQSPSLQSRCSPLPNKSSSTLHTSKGSPVDMMASGDGRPFSAQNIYSQPTSNTAMSNFSLRSEGRNESNTPVNLLSNQSKPLLSEQYETLSDEES